MEPTWFEIAIQFVLTVLGCWGLLRFVSLLPTSTSDVDVYRATVSRGKFKYELAPLPERKTGYEWIGERRSKEETGELK